MYAIMLMSESINCTFNYLELSYVHFSFLYVGCATKQSAVISSRARKCNGARGQAFPKNKFFENYNTLFYNRQFAKCLQFKARVVI